MKKAAKTCIVLLTWLSSGMATPLGPDSERAAKENLEAVLPALAHGLRKIKGDPADCGQSY